MELSKNYTPAEVETRWYQHWLSKGYFNSTPDNRKPYTVVIPPPNVTGVLHMGHTLNETVQDILVRKARMSGYNACWVPGSDHASIATEAKVVQMLKEKGIDKNDLTREEFLRYTFEWKEKYGNIIYSQIARLGCSVDWSRTTFTMDEHYYKAVMKVFVNMYKEGLIYRGARMIHWDVAAKTALSDEEVEYKDVQGILYYVKYKVIDDESNIGSLQTSDPGRTNNQQPMTDDFIVVATQRPETIMGDVAVCVNPNDERYQHLQGKKVIVPLVNRPVPVIADDYVDPSFGTGALKITPAHDINDYNIGQKHHLPLIDTLTEEGKISEAGQVFVGLDRFEARKQAIVQLQKEGLLLKEEDYTTRLGFSQRTNAVVEPRISTQWFVKMKELAAPALKAVMGSEIKFYPEEKFSATYKYWLENVKDWCISRQLWWGQQIPAWYGEDGKMVVAENEEEAKAIFNKQYSTSGTQLTRDPDVLDTWFSSWLWPIEVFKGITEPGNADINYYYPANTLVTAPEIIFFWVARMIMAGFKYLDKKPFSEVYFTGIVRDKQGRKMSKSLGNSPDLLGLIDKYGADAVRFGIMISSPAGNDILFDEAALEQGRNFNNKLWNALKLIKMWKEIAAAGNGQPMTNNFPVFWFENRLSQARNEIDNVMQQFKLSEALKVIYSLIWDDFCSWYLEWVKPGYEQAIDVNIYNSTIHFFEQLLQLLHPYMPFVTEEIYHLLQEQTDDLCIKQFDVINQAENKILMQGELVKKIITAVRDTKNKNGIKSKEKISLYIQTPDAGNYKGIETILAKQLNADTIEYTQQTVMGSVIVAVEKDKFFLQTAQQIDTGSLKDDLLKDLDYQRKFLDSVVKKLSNERFVQNAKPDVVRLERKKQADAEVRIKTIEESLANL